MRAGSFAWGAAAGLAVAGLVLWLAIYLTGGAVLGWLKPEGRPYLPAPKPRMTKDDGMTNSDLGAASPFTAAMNAQVLKDLPFENTEDFDFAARGFIATRKDPKIRNAAGKVVYDLSAYDFLKGERPAAANPSLWRQAQLLTRHGLFKVTDRVYQVRGFDVSTVSFIDTPDGYIVVDPLTTVEVAAAALELVHEHVGKKPVIAVIYSHSHADHYGGVRGVASEEDVAAGKIQIVAPEGFMEHAVSENIIAGTAMARRGRFQFGFTVAPGPEGEMTSGLGPRISTGTLSLLRPTVLIVKTGQTLTIGGTALVFQLTPGTEAPAEMNFYLPQLRSLFMAENANATMHNILPLRGALVRDSKAWADYLTESIRLWADQSDTMFAAHGVPRFGGARIKEFLIKHRDAYKFLHDQSVRLLNAGLNGEEIAEVLELPEPLAREWYNRGYYGTMRHNAKAVYQRYMGWYDGNPASLNPLPPEETAKRTVEAMGGAAAVVARAKAAIEAKEFRWASQLLNAVVFADPANAAARDLLAEVYRQFAFQAESGVWRNVYLTGAQELTQGVYKGGGGATVSLDTIRATTTAQMLDFAAVRINPERARGRRIVLNLVLTDFGEKHLLTLDNSVLIHEQDVQDPAADATLTMKRADLLQTLFFGVPLTPKTLTGEIAVKGKADAYPALVALIDPLDVNFNVVEP
jgi:alkyl sulfatase BDS1-like metallo-beta-lactamase superfamily hydrolase